MKKEYISPVALVVNIETTSMLAASQGQFQGGLDNTNKIGDTSSMLGRGNDGDDW